MNRGNVTYGMQYTECGLWGETNEKQPMGYTRMFSPFLYLRISPSAYADNAPANSAISLQYLQSSKQVK